MSPEARNIDPNSVRPETFNRLSYFLIPRLIEPALADFFWSYVHIRFASLQLSSGDAQVPNTPSGYGDPAFDGLLEYLRPRIEECAGLALYPTYSYFRLYKRGDVLKRHRDRSACEISVTLNIGQAPAAPWPIYVERHEHYFGRFLILPCFIGFPNQFFNDLWVVGSWRADHGGMGRRARTLADAVLGPVGS